MFLLYYSNDTVFGSFQDIDENWKDLTISKYKAAYLVSPLCIIFNTNDTNDNKNSW